MIACRPKRNRTSFSCRSSALLLQPISRSVSPDWLAPAPGKEALPTEPALAPIDPSIIQCFYGADEDDTACQSLQGKAEVIRTAGSYHFDGDYAALAQRILDGFRQRAGL